MVTITQYQRKAGTLSYTAQIRIKRDGKIVWSESNTFNSRRLAEAWAKIREVQLAEPGVLDRLVNGNQATDAKPVLASFTRACFSLLVCISWYTVCQ